MLQHLPKVRRPLYAQPVDSRSLIIRLDHKGFRTDTDISQNGKLTRERELQAWTADGGANSTPANGAAPRNDEITFGTTGTGSWDQFSANQQLFGVTTNYDEELYTTKLDRSRPDFKERERQAMQIANEIQNVRTTSDLSSNDETHRLLCSIANFK